MTRLLVLSDLHLEHDPAWSLPEAFPPFDVAVFAGDVDGSPERAVRRLAMAPGLAGRPIVYVPGNHEFYDGHLGERLAAGRASCVGTNIHWLHRRSVMLDGVRFVGAILWTDYRLFGDVGLAMDSCRRGMNDHRLIEVGRPRSRRLFYPEDAMALHACDKAHIEEQLARPFAGPTVVVTHHAPHPGSVAARYARDPTTAGFVSDLGDVIRLRQPELWIHGHVHTGFDYRVGDTRIVANPKGYGPKRRGGSPENLTFDPGLVVDVPHDDSGFNRKAAGSLATPKAPETMRIACWTLVRLRNGGDTHVLGYRVANLRGRTSSPIRSFDPSTRTATTASGNRYVLVGEPAEGGLDDLVVLAWLAAHDLSRRDVERVDLDELRGSAVAILPPSVRRDAGRRASWTCSTASAGRCAPPRRCKPCRRQKTSRCCWLASSANSRSPTAPGSGRALGSSWSRSAPGSTPTRATSPRSTRSTMPRISSGREGSRASAGLSPTRRARSDQDVRIGRRGVHPPRTRGVLDGGACSQRSRMMIQAYSPDDITRIELHERVLEILRRAGADRRLKHFEYLERLERYRRERERERARQSGAVTVTDPTPTGDGHLTDP